MGPRARGSYLKTFEDDKLFQETGLPSTFHSSYGSQPGAVIAGGDHNYQVWAAWKPLIFEAY